MILFCDFNSSSVLHNESFINVEFYALSKLVTKNTTFSLYL